MTDTHRPKSPSRRSVLLTEAASTSARQTLYALGRMGHTIDVCDPQRLCLGRFSRYVRTWHRCPSFTADPVGYVEFLLDLLDRGSYDVLFPVHDQVYLLSRFRETLGRRAGVALPEFGSVERVQSKVQFVRLLEEVGLPHPRTEVVPTADGLDAAWDYPCYVKLEYSTAGRGVWRVEDAEQMRRVAREVRGLAARLDEPLPLVVQQPAAGTFHAVQAVFRHGELAAAHCYRGRAVGVGGSFHGREGLRHPFVLDDVARLGAALGWHGAIHAEYFLDEAGRPTYIEANPRIGETLNATLSGVNLSEALVRVSLDEPVEVPASIREGVKTHAVMMGVMAAAERGEGRRAIAAELWQAWRHRGVYADSQDELTRPREDPWSLLPAAFVTAQLLFRPGVAQRIVRRAVENYGLDAAAVRQIAALPAERTMQGRDR